MDKRQVVRLTAMHVKKRMLKEGTGHDWWHVYRVWQNAKRIATYERGSNPYIVQLGALLHDISDWKFSGGDEEAGARESRKLLQDLGVDSDTVNRVCEIVRNVSFKGGFGKRLSTKEGMIVQDADRLDALGAIGIARAFAYGGSKSREIYNPGIKPLNYKDFDDFKKRSSNSTTVNHFYEKLFRLRSIMNTKGGRALAKEREEYMKDYLEQFYAEWNGEV